MKLIARMKLVTTPEQRQLLLETLEQANAACNYMSGVAWEEKTFRQFDLHKLAYYDVRERFNLSAQMTVRCIAKVANAYKLDRKNKRTFSPRGSVSYDSRILNYRLSDQTVSIWTLKGRIEVPFVTGERQLDLLRYQQGESDLIYRKDKGLFFLHAVCEIPEEAEEDVTDFLGVDLGVVNIATTSDGDIHASDALDAVRERYARQRAELQAVGTRSATRKLQRKSRQESNFRRTANHTIAKRIVVRAQDTGRGIALEDLKGIRARTTVRRSQRARHHSWSFHQRRSYIEYKARLAAVPVQLVNPRNTSRTCPACAHVAKQNRPSQALFRCVECDFSGHADTVAAINIAHKGRLNRPMVAV